MITKREIENIEREIRAMSAAQYDGLIGWLSNGGEGDLYQARRRGKTGGDGEGGA